MEKKWKRKRKGREEEKEETRTGVTAKEGKNGKEKGKDLFVVWSGVTF